MKVELVYCTKFNWMNERNYRKAVPYAALSAMESADETYEEFETVTSGYVNRRSYALHTQSRRDMAVELFNIAVRNGFIDC